MKLVERHAWDLSPEEAVELQRALATEVDATTPLGDPGTVAGADVSYNKFDPRLFASVVVLDAETLAVVESVGIESVARFPYVPGLLSFREVPALLEAFRLLRTVPDVVVCDGQGIVHPRRLGLASHLGLWLGLPTIGAAKSRLCGDHEEPGPERGDCSPIRVDGEIRGEVLRTRRRVKPIFVSPGHRCDVPSATRIVLRSTPRYRVPEPTRHAHDLVNQLRRAAGPTSTPSTEP
ncbi:MAG: deoxyribonuclease V [Isosphaeraceae bacterium]